MNRGKVLAALLLLVTFAAGALSGMAAEEAFGLDWFDFFEERREGDGNRLLAGLNLSPEQRVKADQIMERQEDDLEAYWEARLPEIARLTEQSYDEFRAILTPSQQVIFDERVRRLGGRTPAELAED